MHRHRVDFEKKNCIETISKLETQKKLNDISSKTLSKYENQAKVV